MPSDIPLIDLRRARICFMRYLQLVCAIGDAALASVHAAFEIDHVPGISAFSSGNPTYTSLVLCNHTPDGTGIPIPRVGHVGTELYIRGIVNSQQAFTLIRARDGLSGDILARSMPLLPVSTRLLLVLPGVATRYERV